MHGDTASPLYLDLVQRLKALAERIVQTETVMARLARNYALRFSGCPLVLYAKIERARRGRGPNPRFDGGRPRGLYWGRLTRTHVVIHLKGRLTSASIWRIARRGRLKPLFWAFERERLHLNRTRTFLVKAREDLRKTVRRYSGLPSGLPVSALLADLHPLGIRHIPVVHGLFHLAREVEEIRDRMEALIARSRGESPAIRLLVRRRRIYVAIDGMRIPAERLARRSHVLREAAALNRAARDHRARLARVERLLRRAEVIMTVRRRPRRKDAG